MNGFTFETPYWTGALCAGDTDRWFPPRGVTREQIKAIKEVCYRCPIREACLQFALDTNEIYGVWGGTSERERRNLRRARANNPTLTVVPT